MGQYRLSLPSSSLDVFQPAITHAGERGAAFTRSWRAVAFGVLRLLMVAVPVVIAGVMAYRTVPNTHPDEFVHIDACEYFRTHWLMPELGSKQVVYSINGISRVYNGEIVYLLFGKAGYFPRKIWPAVNPYYIYRYCNVGLLAILLGVLAIAHCKWFAPWLMGLFLICIPQVIYLFSYANSDAFGVFASVLLFLQAARMLDQSPRDWGIIRIGTFMLLFLLTLLSKVGFEMDILLPLGMLVLHLIRTRSAPKLVLVKIILPMLAVYALASWWNPQISLRGSAWHKQMMELREQKAIVGRRPSDPQEFGGAYPFTLKALYIAANHGTYGQVLRFDHYAWAAFSGESFYGRFGYMLVILPHWIYLTVGCLAIGLLLMTLMTLWRGRKLAPRELVFCMVLAPLLIAFNVVGSIYHSFHYDWQPQGRYLFASLVPVFLLCFGNWNNENRFCKILRGMIIAVLIPLSGYILIKYVALNPGMGLS